MDAVEYIKEAKRICKSRSVCKSVSGKCPLLDENGHCTATADICAADIIEKEMKKCCGDRECDECKRTYWLTEVTDNGNVY